MENTNNSLTAVAPHGGYSLSVVGDTYRIIIGSKQTNGAYALIDMLIPKKVFERTIWMKLLEFGPIHYNRPHQGLSRLAIVMITALILHSPLFLACISLSS